ncbi:MAG: hypothetical protein HYZ53_27580, partial [Planctomycetes bacterium]|nr:hypothetical protein [Planctomycetota bacterium]
PLLFSPLAQPDDGFFDVMWHNGKTRRDTFRLFWNALWRTPLRMVDVGFTRGRRVSVRADTPIPVQVDGDPGGALPANFELVPRALPLLVPMARPTSS